MNASEITISFTERDVICLLSSSRFPRFRNAFQRLAAATCVSPYRDYRITRDINA
jgi:hypothetical protein